MLTTTVSSYGDVAPYNGLGVRLRAAGHDVALATHESFAPLVQAAGLKFRGLPAGAGATGGAGAGRTRAGRALPRPLLRTAAPAAAGRSP
ncbi:glycosyltransferase [Streptomyces sp. NPDC003006]